MPETTNKILAGTRNLLKMAGLFWVRGAKHKNTSAVITPVEIINCAIKAISSGVVKFTDDDIYIPNSLTIYVSEPCMASIRPFIQTFMVELNSAVMKHVNECLCTTKNAKSQQKIEFKVDVNLVDGAIRCDAELHDQLP